MNGLSVPIVWLGQSVDTSSICSGHPELACAPFLTSLGCAIRRPSLKRTHFHRALKAKLGITGPLMVDSGGFALSSHSTPRWTVGNVADLVSDIDADVFVTLDYPPGPLDSGGERRRKIGRSVENAVVLTERFPHKLIMPVVHGRTMAEISWSVELISQRVDRPSWIGLGGIVPLLQHRWVSAEVSRLGPEAFIARALAIIRGAFPAAKIHVFGAGGTRTFPAIFAFGADSADSIGWRQAAGFGSIFLPLRSQRVITWNPDSRPPRKMLDECDLAQLELCRCPICAEKQSIGAKLYAFRAGFEARSIHNAWTIAHQIDYWPKDRAGMITLIESGCLGSAWAEAASARGDGGQGRSVQKSVSSGRSRQIT